MGDRSNSKTCPICMSNSSAAKLTMGIEPAFYVDSGPPDYCFVPCGHMANMKTVKYWSGIPIPCGTSGFQSACPFCATPLQGNLFIGEVVGWLVVHYLPFKSFNWPNIYNNYIVAKIHNII